MKGAFKMRDDNYPKQPLRGAKQIGRVAGFVDEDGRVDLNKTYRSLMLGYIDASKMGKEWVSTPERVLAAFTGGAK
jgi:hypothetical protein